MGSCYLPLSNFRRGISSHDASIRAMTVPFDRAYKNLGFLAPTIHAEAIFPINPAPVRKIATKILCSPLTDNLHKRSSLEFLNVSKNVRKKNSFIRCLNLWQSVFISKQP
jgi:hypothetical protein